MSLGSLNFKSRRAGKQPRANIFVRLDRALRRKRAAYARTGAAHALNVAQREIARFYEIAAAHKVPVDPMPPLPVLAELPGKAWIEHLQGMDALKDPVRPAPEMVRA